MKRYLVEYSTGSWSGLRIAVKCETRADVRPILKRHLGNREFHIDNITECNFATAPWYRKENEYDNNVLR